MSGLAEATFQLMEETYTHPQVTVLDPGPIPYAQLADAGDVDLERQLDARYGGDLSDYNFRLVELPIELLAAHIPEGGTEFYKGLAAEDAALEASVENSGEELSEFELEQIEEEFQDGEERYAITSGYRDDYAASREVAAIVIDWIVRAEGAEPTVELLDGFHRLAGAFSAGRTSVRAYELLAD